MTNPEVPQGQSLDDLNLTLAHLLPAMRALLAILEGGNQEAGTTLREMMQTMMAIEQGLTALAARGRTLRTSCPGWRPSNSAWRRARRRRRN